ncbi:hypothetical protein [Pontibacter sp. SGAir0037]|uniref:hypothetical protein n=1 Tax=Pontibacter sp. SGAir0037 TaxID=2571030 RepID=UPI0010CCEE1B|nr:hypothetical protein [Pontibacter sp. SGAir0037]QCR23306.1 hypothetical protein C1N53_13805 [Pontibacter sp. SGAir0037]
MQYHPAILASAVQHLCKYFDLDFTQDDDVESISVQVARLVKKLLHNDLNRLMHILYRIDVEERLVKEAMMAPTEEQICMQLADLILKREMQRAWTRTMFRHN